METNLSLSEVLSQARAELIELTQDIATRRERASQLSAFIASTEQVLAKPVIKEGSTLAQAAATILLEHGAPMRLSEILDALVARGVHIGGPSRTGQQANLLNTIKRSPLIQRIAYGKYALTEWTTGQTDGNSTQANA